VTGVRRASRASSWSPCCWTPRQPAWQLRDVVASVRTARTPGFPGVAVNAMPRGAPVPRVQRIRGDVTTRGPRSALS
jgi:hypothetical protein